MAVFYPSLEIIYADQMEKHTDGELKLLEILKQLDDSYYVYYQPHINCAHPDIIIEKESCGILIIETNDWNLEAYRYIQERNDKFGYLIEEGKNVKLSTPFEQVEEYKGELFEVSPPLYLQKLHHEEWNAGRRKTSPVYGVVRCAVYFSKANIQKVKHLFGENKIKNTYGMEKYDYTTCWTSDDTEEKIAAQVRKILTEKPLYYTQEVHEDITTLLCPSEEWLEQIQPITLTPKQAKLAVCQPGQRTRVRGSAGSGKTMVLAQKAINCFKAKETPVLILTYNITLKNYIQDKIAVNAREISRQHCEQAFEILHFDEFLPEMIQKYGLKKVPISRYKKPNGEVEWDAYRAEQMKILREAGNRIKRYETIIIDEGQDYESGWFSFINDVFLAPNADYLVVVDEKQNIYNRSMDQGTKMPRMKGFSTIGWKNLKENHRLSNTGIRLAEDFQREFFWGKYTIDEPQQLDMFGSDDKQAYCHLDGFDAEKIFSLIQNFCHEDHSISRNDICILSSDTEKIRELDKIFRNHEGKKSTTTVCETQEVYSFLEEKYRISENGISEKERKKRKAYMKEEVEKIRRMKKRRFQMNTGKVKICTVHSFKGWEIHTAVLLIDSKDVSDEIVYTAITRAKKNLLVIDCGENRYQKFFEKEFGVA